MFNRRRLRTTGSINNCPITKKMLGLRTISKPKIAAE
jgi:hypothetical protein